MHKKIISFSDVIASGLLSLLFFIFFCLFVFISVNSLRTIPSPSRHALEWLPENYPRLEERFTIRDGRIKYSFSQDEVNFSCSSPFKSAVYGNWTVQEIKSWDLLQNALIIRYGIDYLGFGITSLVAIVFMILSPLFAWRFFHQLRKLSPKGDHTLENHGAV